MLTLFTVTRTHVPTHARTHTQVIRVCRVTLPGVGGCGTSRGEHSLGTHSHYYCIRNTCVLWCRCMPNPTIFRVMFVAYVA